MTVLEFIMNKLILSIPLALCLAGCTSNAKIEHLEHDIQALNNKINQLQQDIDAMRPEIQQVKDETARAHYRLDVRNSPYKPRL